MKNDQQNKHDTHASGGRIIPDSDGQLFKSESGRKILMERYGDFEFPFSGVNEDGERVLISIANDSIVINTFQTNGWVRVNYYDADGLADGETFNGRWK